MFFNAFTQTHSYIRLKVVDVVLCKRSVNHDFRAVEWTRYIDIVTR